MEALVLVVAGLVTVGVLDLLAWLKGADSTESFCSSEWEKRTGWQS